MASSRPYAEPTFEQALAEFNDIETRLGELAAYVSDVADGLSHDPESLIGTLAGTWPDVAALIQLRARWLERRDALLAAWQKLGPASRALYPLPPFGAVDRSLPVI